MFVLEALTKVRCLDVRVLSQKDRKPDEMPGAQLFLKATMGASDLAMFDGLLPGMLYRKPQAKKQGELDGIESAELTDIGSHVKSLPWQYEQTGCTLTIDIGTGGKSNVTLSDVKVHTVSINPHQKGVMITWKADAPVLSDATRGKLTGLKSTDVHIMLAGPTVDDGQQEIEGAGKAPAAKTAAPAAQKTPEQALEAAASGQASKDKLDASGASPFPKQEPAAEQQAAAPAARGRRVVNTGAAVE